MVRAIGGLLSLARACDISKQRTDADEFATYPQRGRITPEFKPLGGAIGCAMRRDKHSRQNNAKLGDTLRDPAR